MCGISVSRARSREASDPLNFLLLRMHKAEMPEITMTINNGGLT
jgi:hypothetical protein